MRFYSSVTRFLLIFLFLFVFAVGAKAQNAPELKTLKNARIVTINCIIRVNQIECARDRNVGFDEAALHTPEVMKRFRDAVTAGMPNARITWAFSWLALHDQRPNYVKLREMAVEYHRTLGDEITFIPGGYFAPMYSSREQVNRDIHEALEIIKNMVGDGYCPKCLVGGFLAADNLRHLAEVEGIHVAQGTIWSQYGIDNGDGDGSICYPYYPSKSHVCRPAQGEEDFIDCVNLDGWTCDFLCARRFGFEGGFNSRLGVGPIEAYGQRLKPDDGFKEVMATTAIHFDENLTRNGFGWVTVNWELSLVKSMKTDATPRLTQWLETIRERWPDARVVTMGEFGETWRREHPTNDGLNYEFVERGTGLGGSDANLEIHWWMNKDFRLASLRDWQKNDEPMIIDFTRYDLPAAEPADPTPGKPTRNWSLVNRINQKHRRPEDKPIPFANLTEEEKTLVKKYISLGDE